jgi:chromosome partitioning protein
MPKIVACLNSKGGVGKTTTCIVLAEYVAAELERKTLVIDVDWQMNATSMMMAAKSWEKYQSEEKTFAHFLNKCMVQQRPGELLHNYVLKDRGNVRVIRTNGTQPAAPISLIPGSLDMDDIEFKIYRKHKADEENQIVDRLAELLKKSIDGLTDFRYVFVDCPPRFDLVTKAIVKIMNFAVMPFSHQILTQYGLERLVSRVSLLRNQKPQDIPYGALPTRIRNVAGATDSIAEVAKKFKVIEAIIPETEDIAKHGEFFYSEHNGRMTWREKWGRSSREYTKAAQIILKNL